MTEINPNTSRVGSSVPPTTTPAASTPPPATAPAAPLTEFISRVTTLTSNATRNFFRDLSLNPANQQLIAGRTAQNIIKEKLGDISDVPGRNLDQLS